MPDVIRHPEGGGAGIRHHLRFIFALYSPRTYIKLRQPSSVRRAHNVT